MYFEVSMDLAQGHGRSPVIRAWPLSTRLLSVRNVYPQRDKNHEFRVYSLCLLLATFKGTTFSAGPFTFIRATLPRFKFFFARINNVSLTKTCRKYYSSVQIS